MTEFKWPYKVVISDINYGGHMGNDRSLALFHEARIAYLNSLAYSEMNIGEGLGIIMKDAHVVFLAEIFHGDELEISVKLAEQQVRTFDLDYEVIRISDHKKVLKGKTGIFAFDYENKKVRSIPLEFYKNIDLKYGH